MEPVALRRRMVRSAWSVATGTLVLTLLGFLALLIASTAPLWRWTLPLNNRGARTGAGPRELALARFAASGWVASCGFDLLPSSGQQGGPARVQDQLSGLRKGYANKKSSSV